MFYEIPNGSYIDIPDNAFGFTFHCQLPPIGYGKSSRSGKILPTDILKRSDIPQEQYWERPLLPHDFISRRKKEKQVQRIDKKYVDPYLEDIRKREWRRRLRGVWFWNNGELIYLVGVHYFLLTYWKFQGKFFDFRIPDRNYWYAIKYIEEDPNSLGLNDIEKRKGGKTARVGCWLYERTSRMNNHHGGIQSKADDDAWEVFKKGVIHPWKSLKALADFFCPTYDTMKGDDPNDELRFFASSRRGSKADEELDETEEPLDSFIDFKASTEGAYDGPEVDTYVADEAGKTKKPTSIKERQNIVRYCAEIDGEFLHRKQVYTTTVEPDKGEEENYEFQEMTARSNPLDRDENGRTGTGLYTYFLPAHKGMFFDKYGYPDEERAKTFLLNTMKKLEEDGDTRGLSSFKRKNPMNFKAAFSTDGENALYDPEILNDQLDIISWGESFTEFGDLKWVNDSPFTIKKVKPNGEIEEVVNKLEWIPNPKGDYEKPIGWMPKDANKVYENNGMYLPNNNFAMRGGCDPFKYDKTKDKRRSNCAGYFYQIKDDLAPDDIYNDMFVLRYAKRPNSTKLANMAILKMAWWCGCQVLFERNVNHWKDHFAQWNCSGFLTWMPGEVEPGIATDGAGNTTQLICNYSEAYINEHIKKVYFKTLIRKETGWLGFKVEDTQKFDEPMAAGICLIGVKGKRYMRPTEQQRNIESIMPYRKVS